MKEIKAGSILLVLEGAASGFERTKRLVEEGKLANLLGHEVEAVHLYTEAGLTDERPRARAAAAGAFNLAGCGEVVEILSEFQAGALDEAGAGFVRAHLAECVDCYDLFMELSLIVQTAMSMRHADDIAYPDEEEMLRRLGFVQKRVH